MNYHRYVVWALSFLVLIWICTDLVFDHVGGHFGPIHQDIEAVGMAASATLALRALK